MAMYIEFEEEYLRELYETGHTSDKKHRFQPEVIRGYAKCVSHLKREGMWKTFILFIL